MTRYDAEGCFANVIPHSGGTVSQASARRIRYNGMLKEYSPDWTSKMLWFS